jgi:hypothetical protein
MGLWTRNFLKKSAEAEKESKEKQNAKTQKGDILNEVRKGTF